jgi:hypothetical protein
MNPDELAGAIELLVLKAEDRYTAALNRVQRALYDEIILTLKDLELDQQGYIKQNAVNRKLLLTVDKKINEAFNSNIYAGIVSNYISVIPKIDSQNVKYFTSIEKTFKPNRIFLKNLQTDAISTVERYILRDGLQSQVINPLSQIMSQNINSGGSFTGFMDQIKNYVVGTPTVEGRAMSYTKTYLRDTLFTYSRTFQQAITNDLGLEFYMYSGGQIDTSREFCIERNGKFFSHKEIEQWASLSWSGKKQGTTESSIFLFAGGWNCGHQLIPVAKNVVPKDVIDRQ